MAKSKLDEISAILKKQIATYGAKVKASETGEVLAIGDGIAHVSGLTNVQMGELLLFPGDSMGLVLSLEESHVGVALMSMSQAVKEGDEVKRTGKVITIPVGDHLIGRVLNPLGEPLDGKPLAKSTRHREVFAASTGVMERRAVDEPLSTGIIAIDAMIPIGRGQRELIIGDRQTGKTAVAIDAIINQRGKGVFCVYVAIGQKNSSIALIVEKLTRAGAMDYTTIVVAGASENTPLQYIAPYAGVSIAEEWMYAGKDVLIIYDDLSKHAVAYRTLSLLLRRPPGREAYPGDIFYLHSQLLERAARISEKRGGGSITALPIIETQAGDISAYIPTNVISITDGQIFMMSDLFNAGQRPAIDAGFSVSRVGSTAQVKAMKQVAGSLKLELAQYADMAAFAQFGSDLDESTKKILEHGKKVLEIIKQPQYSPLDTTDQVIILLAVKERIISTVPTSEIIRFKNEVIAYFRNDTKMQEVRKELEAKLREGLEPALKTKLINHLNDFVKRFVASIAASAPAEPSTKTAKPAAAKKSSNSTKQLAG